MVAKKRKTPPRKAKPAALPPPERKRGQGRPRYEPTDDSRRAVEGMAGVGTPEEHIAAILGISEPTLRKHFRKELDLGLQKANAAVGMSLFKKATGNGPQAVTAAIFWAKTRMGWKETTVMEHTGRVEAVSRRMSAREAADKYAATRRKKKN